MNANEWGIVAAIVVLVVTAYLVSLRVHPWWNCRVCGGTGKIHDLVWRPAFGTCPRCGGRGRKPRLGVRVFQAERAKRMRDKLPDHKTADERRG